MSDIGNKFLAAARAGELPNFTVDPDNPATAYDAMPLDSRAGAKVRFTGYGGYEHDQRHAREFLTVDGVYTVARLDVGDWSSTVEFKEFPGKEFNTVMFAAITAGNGGRDA